MIALVVAMSGVARAEEPPLPERLQEDDRPWARDVPRDKQMRARELYRAGNALLEEGLFGQALDMYQQAIAFWDHPGIRFNMAIVLIKLSRMVDAYESLEMALRYGPEALEPQEHAQAVNYKSLLEGQVARLMVTCSEPGARVTLDGKYLFTAPGHGIKLVLTGEHQVVVSKPGLRTVTRSLQVMPRRLNRIDLLLLPRDRGRVLVQRWSPWKPWVVSAAGAAVALMGIPLQLRAQSNLDSYDAEIRARCETGCSLTDVPLHVRAMESRGQFQNRLALTSFAVGGAVVVTGLTLVILNRPHTVAASPSPLRSSISPLVGDGSLGVAARFSF